MDLRRGEEGATLHLDNLSRRDISLILVIVGTAGTAFAEGSITVMFTAWCPPETARRFFATPMQPPLASITWC